MRNSLFGVALLACFSSSSIFAQTHSASQTSSLAPPASSTLQTYNVLFRQAEAALLTSAPKNNRSVTTAISLFERAAQAAPDEDKKFKALVRAGELSSQIRNFPQAANFYGAARTLVKISEAQKATAQFGYAFNRHQHAGATNAPLNIAADIQKEYEKALQFSPLPPKLRIQAHEAVGDILILRGERLLGIREYQKILALPAAGDAAVQRRYLVRIFSELQKVAPSAEALTLAETTFKKLLPLQKSPAAIASVKENFAQVLFAQNQNARAIGFWNEIADDKALPVAARVEVLRKVGAVQRNAAQWPEALKTADKMSTLMGATTAQMPSLLAWRGRERAAVFAAQGDEPKARAEWQAMLARPDLKPDEKAQLWLDIADSYGRERAKTPQTQLISAQKQAYETVWNWEGASGSLRIQALLNQGQLELDAKNPANAIALLNNGLTKIQSWKSVPDKAQGQRAFYLALATIYRNDKRYNEAISSLLSAQQFSAKGDAQILQSAMGVSQDAFAARQWQEARAILQALQNTWKIPRKVYLLNLLEIEIAEQKWAAARSVLNEIGVQTLTPEEKETVRQLAAKIPAA